MAELFIPTLHSFAMGNTFTGSCGMFRFESKPNVAKLTSKEVDFAQSSITASYWHGLFCKSKSTMEGEKTFPMTDEGRLAMKAWLEANI